VKYSDLISFEPIESVIQLTTSNDSNVALNLVKSYVMSDNMAAQIKNNMLTHLSLVDVDDNFLRDDEGKWYITDVTKAGDVAKLREKKLIKEFESYLESRGKLKLFRAEAIRAGFAKLWANGNYRLITETANRLPENIIAEDSNLLMYVDLSTGRE